MQKRATNEVWRLETRPRTQVMNAFSLKIKALMLDPSSSFETQINFQCMYISGPFLCITMRLYIPLKSTYRCLCMCYF